ncbi:hypothetical protein JD844_018218 [Phrynosoma platyrhinos]|uniref:PNPLA domain-containing protein n=1 Tax=Phrynosoma platyrhinos TaxID=52577 RepID=A0ABQ7SN66_PHRPL|nr:hypothetical protein JD844_018218 [Phrynosoma platyrhinos]
MLKEADNSITILLRLAEVDLRMSGAPLSLSFAGGGFLAIYEIGVIQGLLEQAPEILRSAPKVYGSSSGSIIAAAVVCGLSLDDLKKYMYGAATDARRTILGPLAPGCSVVRILQRRLYQILPENSHRMATGRLYISLTRLIDGQNVVVSEYSSKEELIQALICSCFVPIYAGFIPPSFRGVRYVDGGFTNLQPRSDLETAITVSPFTGEIDICPRDCPAIFYSLHVMQSSIQISIENLCRIGYALFPPSYQVSNSSHLITVFITSAVMNMQKKSGLLSSVPGFILHHLTSPTQVVWSFYKRLLQLWKRSSGLKDNSEGSKNDSLSNTGRINR